MRKIAMPVVFLAAACLLCAVASAEQQSPIKETIVRPDVIIWNPHEGFQEFSLRVSGPNCGETADRFFASGETIFFEVAGLADGSYTYQIIGEPILDRETLELIQQARKAGTSEQVFVDLCQEGRIACSPIQADGHFEVLRGRFVDPNILEETRPLDAKSGLSFRATVLTNGDGVIRNSLCVGFDCPNNPSFDDTTILLRENNTRIKFDDTSTISGFPNRDWSLLANDRNSGGANRFMLQDCGNSSQGGCSGNIVFAVEANAPSSALYVDDGGRIGVRTSTPSVEIHVVDGDTPALRLAQSGSGGFAPQTWDVAGNETNFFIRDVTNGSTLPFRIRPGAPSSSIDIAADGEVGIGTSSPNTNYDMTIDGSQSQQLLLRNTGGSARFDLVSSANQWDVTAHSTGNFRITLDGSGQQEFEMDPSGNVTITGSINTTDCAPCVSDYVFEPDYKLMPLRDLEAFVRAEKHLPNVPSQKDVDAAGKLNMTQMQMRLLEKIEELTLYVIDLENRLAALEPAPEQ